MGKRLFAAFSGLILGLFVGVVVVGVLFTSMLEAAGNYDIFIRENLGYFLKLLFACSLVPAGVFFLIPESWTARIILSIAILLIIPI